MRFVTAFAVPAALVLSVISAPGVAQEKAAPAAAPKAVGSTAKNTPSPKSTAQAPAALRGTNAKQLPERAGTNPSAPATGSGELATQKNYERCHGKDSDA